MFLRKREINNHFYWNLEETYREGKKVKKRLIKYLGNTQEAYDFLKNKPDYKRFFNEISSFVEFLENDNTIRNNQVFCMNHLKRLQGIKLLPDNSVDSIVTDAPYELSFLGSRWDSTGITFNYLFWKECLRVLKPGGYLLCFSGTKTYHRMACAIEEAGFQINDKIDIFYEGSTDLKLFLESLSEEQLEAFTRLIDQQELTGMLSWIYGSGFPKSLNISKAIDLSKGAEREVLGFYETHDIKNNGLLEKKGSIKLPITAAATEEAIKWEGWGTALKPANEPIIVAKKPLSENTIVENVLTWGTGGINIDDSRITYSSVNDIQNSREKYGDKGFIHMGYEKDTKPWVLERINNNEPVGLFNPNERGRYPANVIFNDETTQSILDGQSGFLRSGKNNTRKKEGYFFEHGGLGKAGDVQISYGDSGGASRFYYCPKASLSEKEPYNDHPTVKPVRLFKYLIKLVTPKGGLSVDPFCGSGTHAVACLELTHEGYPVDFICFEKDRHYFNISKRRINDTIKRLS